MCRCASTCFLVPTRRTLFVSAGRLPLSPGTALCRTGLGTPRALSCHVTPQELFSMAGELKRASVNFDRGGRSKGTAEVVFARRRVQPLLALFGHE